VTDGQPHNWNQLMAAAQSGDPGSYARLLHEILPHVRLIAGRHHSTPDRVEATVCDVLVTVHRVRHTYDPARPFIQWLDAIAARRLSAQ